MRKKILILGLVVLIGCDKDNQSKEKVEKQPSVESIVGYVFEFVQTDKFSIEKSNKTEFLAASHNYIDKLVKDSALLKKNNKISIVNDSSTNQACVVFKDSLLEGDVVEMHSYLGKYINPTIYVIYTEYYEGWNYFLVTNDCRNNVSIWNKPKISSNNKFIASVLPYGMEGDPIGFQIKEIQLDKYNGVKIVDKIEYNQAEWSPLDFTWDNQDLLIKAIFNDNYAGDDKNVDEKDVFYVRVKMK